MITSYENYLKSPKSLTLEQMNQLHKDILSEIMDDENALEVYDDLIKAATSYATIRAEWLLMSREEKMDRDRFRTSKHDNVILHFNMLARYLRHIGKPAAWRDELGDEAVDRYYRKTIGDFACYLVFVNSINAR